LPTFLARLSQITHLPTTKALNSRVLETRQKTSTSNLNPIIWRRIVIHSLLTNSGMSSRNLLETLNNIWFAGNFPPSWRTSTVIPIPKPAKDASDPNNYRPIALTSCLCKVMERIINNRLVWFLERNKLIAPLQCGFRKRCSTTDHFVRLESLEKLLFNTSYFSTWKRRTIVHGSTAS